MSYIKRDVCFKEFMMHDFVHTLSLESGGILNVPKINDYDPKTKVMTMENVPNMCVSDFYGEASDDISPELFARVREIIRYLYDNYIVYPDITGYNFIEYEDKLWIIDFGHCDFKTHERDSFVETFAYDETCNKWNPWFA